MTLLVGVLVAGCDPSPHRPSPASASPTTTADVRLSAADTYLAALTTYEHDSAPVQQLCLNANSMALLHECWSGRLSVQRAFDNAVAAITFPSDMQADVTTFHYVATRLEGAIAGIAASEDPAGDRGDLGIFSSASVDFLQISSNLREELGIITTPSP